MCPPNIIWMRDQFGIGARTQLYSFRYACTNEPTLPLFSAVLLFRLDAVLRFPFRPASVLDSMPHAKRIDQVALSPDGTQVAFISNGELAIIPANGGASHTITVEANLSLRDVAWSADSKRIAFIANHPGEVPAAQVWTALADGTAPQKHAELKGYVETPRFSPDGSKLALLFIAGMPRDAGPLQPMTPLAGVVDQKIYEQRIATIDLSTDAP